MIMLNNRPFIAISPNGIEPKEPGSFRGLQIPGSYPRAIDLAGGMPALLCETSPEMAAKLFDGLLLSGGADIDPSYFGETILNDTVKCDPIRDQYEVALVQAFVAEGKPIMGICRGEQVIAVAMGGTLYQDLPEQLGFIHFDMKLRHFVTTEEGSVLRRLFGERFRVNSSHHQAVRTLPEGFRVTARSDEGIIEGFEHETLPILTTQFHPERLTALEGNTRTPDFLPLFEHFVNMCRENAAAR